MLVFGAFAQEQQVVKLKKLTETTFAKCVINHKKDNEGRG